VKTPPVSSNWSVTNCENVSEDKAFYVKYTIKLK